MKKFTFKGVLDGFRSSVQAAPRGVEQEIQETLRPDHFQIKKVSRRFYRALRPKVPQIMALAMSSARLGSGAGRCTVERLRPSRGDSSPRRVVYTPQRPRAPKQSPFTALLICRRCQKILAASCVRRLRACLRQGLTLTMYSAGCNRICTTE